jgi:hypothetical protein
MRCVASTALSMIVAVACARTSQAQQHPDQSQREPTWTLGSGKSLTLFPHGDVYPVYIADPHRPTNILEMAWIAAGELPDTRGPLTHLGAGGRFGVLGIRPATPAGRSWQVSIEAGLDAIFDSWHRLDVDGWDGNYGLTVTTASSGPFALKFAVLHVSAHLGDEYQERTGRPRINYTREEASLGVAWQWSPLWRAYAESGVGYRLGHSQLEPWRAQWGVEFESVSGRRIGRYAAADFSALQERGWRVDTAVELGIVLRGGGRTSRLFFQWRDGRPDASVFFQESVSTLSLAFRIDM